jgi:hypothetical protein
MVFIGIYDPLLFGTDEASISDSSSEKAPIFRVQLAFIAFCWVVRRMVGCSDKFNPLNKLPETGSFKIFMRNPNACSLVIRIC